MLRLLCSSGSLKLAELSMKDLVAGYSWHFKNFRSSTVEAPIKSDQNVLQSGCVQHLFAKCSCLPRQDYEDFYFEIHC